MTQPIPGACALPDTSDPRREAADRAAELCELGILDTAPERAYDDLAAVAAYVCGAPVALISLLDTSRQWFKAEIGLGQRELGPERTICVHTVASGGELVIPDLAEDPRTAGSPLVTQDGFRFYAGSAIRGRGDVSLGAVCVLDREPRPQGLDPAQRATLAALARQVSTLFEHRRTLARIADREAELAASERRFRVMTSAMPQMVWTT
ncbi:MAG: GAF domain-containing protein, partial [Parafilimonas terrae]|nr:GAF domain-containing protein [Parafilimonas terrae]